MKKEDKEFAIDLLKSLDIGMGEGVRSNQDYLDDLNSPSRKNIVKTIKELRKLGYTKVIILEEN